MKATVHIAPVLIRWAHIRSGQEPGVLEEHFPDLATWEREGADLTFSRLEEFSRRTYTPVGNFFLEAPPEIDLGIPDFRTRGDRQIGIPSAGLVETLAISQARQAWYRDHARAQQLEPIALVGSIEKFAPIDKTAATLREVLQFEVDGRAGLITLDATYRHLAEVLDAAGVLVMKNGIVGSNTHRPLDPDEFGGFALADPEAPLIFINGADTRAAQIFTVCHETVHLAIGQSALVATTDEDDVPPDAGQAALERWCNRVAAEILVPRDHLVQAFEPREDLVAEVKRLAHLYKASAFVALRSVHDANLITWAQFQAAEAVLEQEWREREVPQTAGGGDFYRTQTTRLGRRFATAVVLDTLGGRTLYADAYRLLATSRHQTFEAFAHHLGVA